MGRRIRLHNVGRTFRHPRILEQKVRTCGYPKVDAVDRVQALGLKPHTTLDAGTYMVSFNLQNESSKHTTRAAVAVPCPTASFGAQ